MWITPFSLDAVNRPNFKVGMKLEAVDRRFPYFVCVATVMDRKGESAMESACSLLSSAPCRG